ncbi:hypothetical protein BTUL_0078g00520 [Botrytis tulipae]|uniref:Cytochrome b561 domain-containing protein n=1 Tax=Botrytis tulipae TaxID=87230 RepID=A0A4Z1ERI8_9HELO|nr:hypothetical protein BTUL_0078g00520 [Botrytis tulipae]
MRFTSTSHTASLLLLHCVLGEPDYLCKSFGHGSNNDFCVSLATYEDDSLSKQDFIMTFNRTQHDAAGWSSIGIGTHMNGSIIFVLYGDPNLESPPTLSIRSTSRHLPPVNLSLGDQHQHGIHIGYIETSWESSHKESSKTAVASFVCYGCNAWYNADRSAITPVLPFIWGMNTDQDFSIVEYADDADLLMHNRFGAFDLDMTKEKGIEPNQLPATISNFLKPYPPASEVEDVPEDYENLNQAHNHYDNDISESAKTVPYKHKRKIWLLHGLLLVASLFLLLPLGAFFIRSGSPHSLYLHLIPQILGSILGLAGITVGFFLSSKVSVWHQYIGIALGTALVAQLGLGLQHHRVFSRLKRKTWMGSVHIWIGRFVLLGGWANFIAGLDLSDYTVNLKVGFAIASAINACGLSFSIYRHAIGEPLGNNLKVPWVKVAKGVKWIDGGIANSECYFALNDENDDGESSDAETVGDGRAKTDGKGEMD